MRRIDVEFTPGTAHPRARQLLAEPFFWSVLDEVSPFGNDTGADTLAFYQRWRRAHPAESADTFVRETLTHWGIADFDDEAFHDRFRIALAFAQLALEGCVEPGVRERALAGVESWATLAGPEGRRRLAEMRRVLEAVAEREVKTHDLFG